MSKTTSHHTIYRRATVVFAVFLLTAVLILTTGCGMNSPAPKPTADIMTVSAKDTDEIQAWTDYYLGRGDFTEDQLDEALASVDDRVYDDMTPKQCRTTLASHIVDNAVAAGYEEDDERVTYSILLAINHARCWERGASQ